MVDDLHPGRVFLGVVDGGEAQEVVEGQRGVGLREGGHVVDCVGGDHGPRLQGLGLEGHDLLTETLDELAVDGGSVHYLLASGPMLAPARLPSVSPRRRRTRSSWIFSCSFMTP